MLVHFAYYNQPQCKSGPSNFIHYFIIVRITVLLTVQFCAHNQFHLLPRYLKIEANSCASLWQAGDQYMLRD